MKGYLLRLTEPIINKEDRINWVKRENIHITMNFLGDTDPDVIETQAEAIQKVVNLYPPFKLGTTDSGVFPHANEPRVLWVATAPYDNTLVEFKRTLDKELIQLGYHLDKRPFQPHITLGRVKSISRKSTFIHEFLSAEVREMNFEVEELIWYQSTLTPSGASYKALKKFKFNTGGQ